jgi:hypothetical protein
MHRVLAEMCGEKDEPESLVQSTSSCMLHRRTLWIEERTFGIRTL